MQTANGMEVRIELTQTLAFWSSAGGPALLVAALALDVVRRERDRSDLGVAKFSAGRAPSSERRIAHHRRGQRPRPIRRGGFLRFATEGSVG